MLHTADLRVLVRPFALAQHELLGFARRCLRQRAELDRVRALVVREALPAERDDLPGVSRGALAERDERLGRSPQCGCGIPMTAHSSTAGWAAIACSTSMLEMFSPPEMMMSLPRSRSSMLPSGCHTARSPEWNQPPANALPVAASSLK